MWPEARPILRVPADSAAYDRSYWNWLDSQVLSASTGRRHRIPQHAELGLNGIHRIARDRAPWWRTRGLWREAIYLLIFAAVLIAGIYLSGRSIATP